MCLRRTFSISNFPERPKMFGLKHITATTNQTTTTWESEASQILIYFTVTRKCQPLLIVHIIIVYISIVYI